jgi:hypothetical protein
MPKIVKKGSGITTRLVPTWNLADPADLASMPLPNDYEAHARPVVKRAKAVLRLAKKNGRRWGREDDSPESYAQRIVDSDSMVRYYIQKGNAVGAARFALVVGGLVSEAQMKFQWERSALQGLARRQDTAKGGSTSARKKKETAAEWQKRIENEARRLLKAGKSDENIGKILSARAGRSPDRVSRYVGSLRKTLAKK